MKRRGHRYGPRPAVSRTESLLMRARVIAGVAANEQEVLFSERNRRSELLLENCANHFEPVVNPFEIVLALLFIHLAGHD